MSKHLRTQWRKRWVAWGEGGRRTTLSKDCNGDGDGWPEPVPNGGRPSDNAKQLLFINHDMKAKIYLSEIDEMTDDELAISAARMGEANHDSVLSDLADELRDSVDNERDSAAITEAIRRHIYTLAP